MRALGMLGFVIVLAVIVWLMSEIFLPHTKAVLQVKQKVEPQVQQMSGHDVTGLDARQSIKLDASMKNGKMTGVLVTDIGAGGAMEKYFGLKRGDVIVEIAPQGGALMPVSDLSSPAEAKDMLLSAYQNSQQVVVIRSEKRITLPMTPSGTPANPLQEQLDIKIPTH